MTKDDKEKGDAIDVSDINIAQGVTEIEVKGQTITMDGEMDNEAGVKTEKDEHDIIEVQGGYIEHKHSLKDHPNIR